MAVTEHSEQSGARLIIRPLGGLYARLSTFAFTLLRFIAGGALVTHGWGKIQDPMANVAQVEGLGFYPGTIWSPLLAGTEFFGGILVALGLLTRPAAMAAMIVLLVTVWFHWAVQAEGYVGAEKSILWATIMFFFVVRGGGRWSLDRLIGREF